MDELYFLSASFALLLKVGCTNMQLRMNEAQEQLH
jgi:hypothetical protein